MITVVVNGEAREVEPASSVDALVEDLGCGRRGVAVAVNLEIVARSAWPATLLQPGDRVEVLRAAQGGC
ncbi:sulfur carrier protein ThiS [Acidiferrimicrobium sp. IK]|uniref:sulfur carrier protein ThiS n=1 Tax=Acidiferrimicrobium sp. IK TaxID=2871700 RepID=UPI0021CB718C|nr:sulfur carrier protein ThiS [Acidiferrimicrobium sp. IK]MCU4183511.1 sulfur carrier protein ThiS [Acidiferrimicrobium sp. IK]